MTSPVCRVNARSKKSFLCSVAPIYVLGQVLLIIRFVALMRVCFISRIFFKDPEPILLCSIPILTHLTFSPIPKSGIESDDNPSRKY